MNQNVIFIYPLIAIGLVSAFALSAVKIMILTLEASMAVGKVMVLSAGISVSRT